MLLFSSNKYCQHVIDKQKWNISLPIQVCRANKLIHAETVPIGNIFGVNLFNDLRLIDILCIKGGGQVFKTGKMHQPGKMYLTCKGMREFL